MNPDRRPRLFSRIACAMLLALGAAAPALAAPGCTVPAALEGDFQPGRLVLMGEVHGTNEAPAAFAAAVCRALELGRPVSVGLEFNRDQVEPLAAYLASRGDEAAVARLLQSPFWTRSFQDGRSSLAMLGLVERLRVLKQRYPRLTVFALYDDTGLPAFDAGASPDARMAARVRAEHARQPDALLLTFSGNYHNRLKPLDDAPDSMKLPQPMGALLADLAPRAVELNPAGGSAWVCTPECGVQTWKAVAPPPANAAAAFQALADTDAYTSRWSLGPATASLPAVQARAPAQAAAADAWRPGWSAAPDSEGPALKAQTIRQVVRTSIAGTWLRIRLSNLYGKAPLTVGAAHLALHAGDARIRPGTDHALRFAGNPGVTIAPGASVTSDPVELALPALADLAVSLYLPGEVAVSTVHGSGMQTAFIAPGDQAAAPDLPGAKKDDSRYFLTDLEVLPGGQARTLVVLGDSVADGVGSGNDRNARWPDLLAARLQADPKLGSIAVVNSGIAGNRLLVDAVEPFVGPSALSRFERDALGKPGVRWIVLHEGINDLATAALLHRPQEQVPASRVIEGLKTLAARAHAQGLKIVAGTLLPYQGTENFYSDAAEAERQAVNAWIRGSRDFDAVVDFDLLLRDPAHPSRLRADFDSGDHLHPNEAGYHAMAEAIDLRMFDPEPRQARY